MDVSKFYQNPDYAQLVRKLAGKELVKTVNFHNTTPQMAEQLEADLSYYSRLYSPVSYEDIVHFTQTGRWDKPRPGIILALFEGYRNNFDVYYPLLEKYGMTGWFFIISDFPDVPEKEQRAYALAHDIDPCERCDTGFGYPGEDRIAMTWDEIRQLSEKHVIISHTASHLSLSKDDSAPFLETEIIGSKHKIEKEIGKPVDVFCTLWGHSYLYSEKIAEILRRAGYKYVWGGHGAIERIG